MFAPGPINVPVGASIGFDGGASSTYIVRDSASNFLIYPSADWRQYWDGSSGNWYWQGAPNFDNKMYLTGVGDLWIKGGLTALNIVASNNVTSHGGMNVAGRVTAGEFMAGNGIFRVAWNDNYYLARDNNTGQWTFVENAQWNFAIYPDGSVSSRGQIYAGTLLVAQGATELRSTLVVSGDTSVLGNFWTNGNLRGGNGGRLEFIWGGSGTVCQFASELVHLRLEFFRWLTCLDRWRNICIQY